LTTSHQNRYGQGLWKGALLTACLLFGVGCNSGSDRAPYMADAEPADGMQGERLFNAYCATCHGKGAVGTDRGPTFLSKIYEPNHHGDAAFHLAIQRGVRAHHWSFGDMPKIQGLSPEQAVAIIRYIRKIQEQAGIS